MHVLPYNYKEVMFIELCVVLSVIMWLRYHVTWCLPSSQVAVVKQRSNKTCLKWVQVACRSQLRVTRTLSSLSAQQPCRSRATSHCLLVTTG